MPLDQRAKASAITASGGRGKGLIWGFHQHDIRLDAAGDAILGAAQKYPAHGLRHAANPVACKKLMLDGPLRIAPVVVALFALLISGAAAAGEFRKADAPAWAEDLAIPPEIPAQRSQSPDGIYFLLSDDQITWQGPDKLSYSRTVTKVIERAGLERAAAISSDFAPEFEDLTLVRLNVIRDGKVIAWRDKLKEDIFRRETRLESGIIDGTLTVFLQLPDLKVGDTVDVIWLHRSAPVIKGAGQAVYEYLDYRVPVAETRVVVHWPSGVPLNVAALPDRIEHTATPESGGQRLEWRLLNAMPNKIEDNTPVEDDPDAAVRISADADWTRFSSLLAKYYEADYPLPPEWLARLDALKSQPDEDAAIAALRMVQDDIRYVSLSVGAGGIYARPPSEVITSGFGDCKDKALLYRVMLHHLGIDAAVALTDVNRGYALTNELPQANVFDHAIVQVRLDGKTYWADATASYEGGDFTTGAQPDFGFALPLRAKGQAFLEPLAVTPERSSSFITETFRFTVLGVFLDVQSEYRRDAANWKRQEFAVKTAQEISDGYFDYYRGHYPGLRMAQPVTVQDDRDRNIFATREMYFLSRTALAEPDLLADFRFGAEDFTSDLPRSPDGARIRPMTVGGAKSTRFVTRVVNGPIDFNPPPPVHLQNAGFEFDFNGTATPGGNMELEWMFRRTGAPVAAKDAAAVIRDDKLAEDNISWTWDISPRPQD